MGEAPPRAGWGWPARRAAGIIPTRQGDLERRGGRPGPGLDRRADPGPARAAVRLVDQPGRARADRAALREALGPDRGAAPPATLGPAPAEAPGPGEGAPARRDRGLARDHLSGHRQTGQSGAGSDLLGR